MCIRDSICTVLSVYVFLMFLSYVPFFLSLVQVMFVWILNVCATFLASDNSPSAPDSSGEDIYAGRESRWEFGVKLSPFSSIYYCPGKLNCLTGQQHAHKTDSFMATFLSMSWYCLGKLQVNRIPLCVPGNVLLPGHRPKGKVSRDCVIYLNIREAGFEL